jgi:hypothetical protein
MKTTSKLERITPERATSFLNHNKGNRKLRPGIVEKYAHDMTNGLWTECSAPVVFYDDGEVADGQHRLWAIVESGTTQKFFVVRGFPRGAGLNMDTHAPRTLVDNARISKTDTELTNTIVSWTRACEQGDQQKQGNSYADRLSFVAKHREAVVWVANDGNLKGRYLRNAVIGAAMARAWYHEEDKVRLAAFGRVFSTGFAEGEHDSAAIALRNYFMTASGNRRIGWRDSFLRAMNAVSYFMRGKKLHMIKGVKDEAYPLPTIKGKKS